MKKITILAKDAPAAVGPYSHAVKTGNLVFCSGSLALDPKTGILRGTNAAEQAALALDNLRAILEASGSGLDRVVKTTIYLKNIDDFQAVNEIYASYFTKDQPARTTIEVSGLPKNALVEIDAVAIADD